MKPHPEFTNATDIIREMAEHAESGDDMNEGPRRLGGPPETPEERAEAREALNRIIKAGGVRFICIGCGEQMSVDDGVGFCACGGFVCAACQRVEEDGVCNHERFAFLPGEEDDDA